MTPTFANPRIKKHDDGIIEATFGRMVGGVIYFAPRSGTWSWATGESSEGGFGSEFEAYEDLRSFLQESDRRVQ